MDVFSDLFRDFETMAIIGMSKNSGKTVALNALLEEGERQGISLGITSIGRDGESVDLVTETNKPKIYLTEGNFIVTTTELLKLSDAVTEILELSRYSTPLGKVVVGKIRYSGFVQISGPQQLGQIKGMMEKLKSLGAQRIIVDGALDRKTSAAPQWTEGVILASGAQVDRHMETVVEKTAHIAGLFALPEVKEFREEVFSLLDKGGYGLVSETGEVVEIPLSTALNAGRKLGERIQEDTRYLVISGALTQNTIRDILSVGPGFKTVETVVFDGTKVFCDHREFKKFQKRGLRLRVYHNARLGAVTVNPYAPAGYRFDGEKFQQAMKKALPNIPIIDVERGTRW